MTNDKAVKLLHRIADSQFDGIHGDERREALSMAVRALEPNLGNNGSICTKTGVNDEDRTTGDCISRQQAIDALDKHIDTFDAIDTNYLCGLRTAMSILKEMPSAQPTYTDEEIQRMQDLESAEIEKAYQLGYEEGKKERKMGKWIKLDMHANLADHKCTACGEECYVPTCMGEPMYTYCPNCGARMDGESDE